MDCEALSPSGFVFKYKQKVPFAILTKTCEFFAQLHDAGDHCRQLHEDDVISMSIPLTIALSKTFRSYICCELNILSLQVYCHVRWLLQEFLHR